MTPRVFGSASTQALPVVFVSVEFEKDAVSGWDTTRKEEALDAVNEALDWMAARGLTTGYDRAEPTGELTITRAELDDPSWGWVPVAGGQPILYVVSTEGHRGAWLAGRLYGVALSPDGATVVLDHYYGSAANLPALIAHELGHTFYGWPDFEHIDPSCRMDLMCTPLAAYRAERLGCWTLAYLGTPCQRTSLPIITGQGG